MASSNVTSTAEPTRSPAIARVVAGFAALVCAGLVVHFAHTLFGFGSPQHDFLIEDWVYDFITVAAALVTLGRAAVRRDDRLCWALIGSGLFLWAASDVYWSVHLTALEEAPFPSIADAGYLGGYLFVMAGIGLLARSRVRRMSAIVWTDIVIGALCLAAIGTTVLLEYVIENMTGSPAQTAVAVAYPVLDVVTLAVAAAALTLTGWRPGRGLALVAAGIAIAGVGDAVYTYQSLAGTYDSGAWNNSLWPLANVLIAAGAVAVPSSRRVDGSNADWRAFASPSIFAFAVFAFLVVGSLTDTAVAATLSSLTLAAIVVRVGLTINENRRLMTLLQQDALTRLGNRSKLVLDLGRVLDGDAQPHLLVLLDLDGFKAYNDAFGHPAGDAVLTRVGGKLATAVVGRGNAYRLGGDEFAVLAPAGDGSIGLAAAAAAALSEQGKGFRITSSVGYAELPREASDTANALQLADQRMYADKDGHRPTPGGEVQAVLARVLQQRAPELREHGETVAGLAQQVAGYLQLQAGERTALVRAAELHDIGKVAIPDAILHKPGPLDDQEWEFMRQHTILGERILAEAPSLAAVGELVRSSHERWDGSGYPDRLEGEAIPLAARIIFACDAYDAMRTRRPYAVRRTHTEAIAELCRCSGSMFDPKVVEALGEVLTSPRRTAEAAFPVTAPG